MDPRIHTMAALVKEYLFQNCNQLLIQSPLAELTGDLEVGDVVDSWDFPLFVGEEPHDGIVAIIEDDGIWDVEDEGVFMFFVAGAQCE